MARYCNCCPSTFVPKTRDCRPYRVEMSGYQKLDPHNSPEMVCNVKNCNIYGGHDTTPFPDYPCPARKIKIKDPNKNSLGFPVGVVASNINFKSEEKPADIVLARYSTCLKAFARLHLNPETMWNSVLLDELMREGLALYSASVAEETKMVSPANIYSTNERKILREFEMSGCKFHVELVQKFRPSSFTSEEKGPKGDGLRPDVALAEFKPALKAFFRQFKHCLVNIGTLYYLIWRSKKAYFVLDVCGRRPSDLNSDREKGVAMLFCLRTLENVRHLLLTLSVLPKVDTCALREIKMVKVVTPSGGTIQRDYGTRTHQYEIINDDYAYLKATLHLTLNKADLMRNRSAFPVGVATFVASKIDHPATWNSKMLNKLICFGVNFCQCCWYKCLANDPVHVEEFPTLFHLGQFKIHIEVVPRKHEGIWHCVAGYKHTALARSIEDAFKAGDNKLLLQINYQMYTIWKKNDFIYLFDPYRHRILGKPGEPEVYEEMEKSATQRMFRSFDVFLNTLNHILLDSNRSSPFFIHTVKVKGIQLKTEPDEEAKLENDGEVKSLNEHICFDESEELCQKALGEISDYEDEDLRSDVDELELRTSSSEAEPMGEEEGGLDEGMEGMETSSSGDGRGGRHRRGKGGKGKSRKSDGSQGAPARKSAGGKTEMDRLLQELDELSPEARKKRLAAMDPKQRKALEEEEEKRFATGRLLNELNGLSPEAKKKRLEAMDPQQRKALEEEEERRRIRSGTGGPKKLYHILDQLDDLSPEDRKKRLEAMDPQERKAVEQEEEKRRARDRLVNELSELSPEARQKRLEAMDPKERKLIEQEEEKRRVRDNLINELSELSPEARKKRLEAMDPQQRKAIEQEEAKRRDRDRTLIELSQLSPEDRKKRLDAMDPQQRKAIEQEEEKRRVGGRLLNELNQLSPEERKKRLEAMDPKERKAVEEEEKRRLKGEPSGAFSDINKTDEEKLVKGADSDIKNMLAALGEEYQGKDYDEFDKKLGELEKAKAEAEGDKAEPTPDIADILPKKKGRPRDGTEADDEYEDEFMKTAAKRFCSAPNPNRYPGYCKCPVDMAVVGSENGSYESLAKLLEAGFLRADRILTMTPWGTFVVFRCMPQTKNDPMHYYLFDGCTCNVNRFRHLDLTIGTAGLLCFQQVHDIIEYMRRIRKKRSNENRCQRLTAEKICAEYCN